MRSTALALVLVLAACSAVPPTPAGTDYAAALIARSAVPAPAAPPAPLPTTAPAGDERSADSGVTSGHPVPAGDEKALDAFLAEPFAAADLAALAVLRSEAVAVARSKLEAARTGYRQAADLDDLVALYRSYTRDLDTRVGPARHRRPAAAIAPSPNITTLSGEVVDRTVALAREGLRAAELAAAAEAGRAHAEVAHWAESRRIVAEDVSLLEGLLRVMRAKLETGQTDQAGYLALRAEVAARRTELSVLEKKAPALRARMNGLLARAEDAPVNLDLAPAAPGEAIAGEEGVVTRALADRPAMRMASLRSERAEIAVRMAETMTLPRMDLGSSRYERERAGEAGVDRGPVFPDPGRMIMPRSDFGVREAQVTEMRARALALAAAEKETAHRTATVVRRALFAATAAHERLATLNDEIVPFAAQSLRAARGAYEGNRSGYLDLLAAARRHVKARLDRSGARRDLSNARADLLVASGFDSGKEEER